MKIKKSRSLLLSTLVEKRACNIQVELFKEHFSEEVQVTEGLALSMSSVFDWNWASENLLSATAWDKYDKVYSTALAEYYKVRDTAWAECDKVCTTARDEFYKVCAVTFAKLYIKG